MTSHAICSLLLVQRAWRSMKNHLEIIPKCMIKLTSTKDSKIFPKCFPKPLQNPPKWSESNSGNRFPVSTKLPESFQDDFWAQHDPKMIQKSSHKASKMHPKWPQNAPYDMIIMTLQLCHYDEVMIMRKYEHVHKALEVPKLKTQKSMKNDVPRHGN